MDLLSDIIAPGQTVDAKVAPTVMADVGQYGELLAYAATLRQQFCTTLRLPPSR